MATDFLTTGWVAGLDGFAATVLLATLTGFLAAGLAWGLGAALATGLDGAAFFATGFAVTFAVTFADDLASGLTALAAGFPAGLASACTLVLPAVALLSFPDLAFTSCLLAERFCTCSVSPAAPPMLLEGFFDGTSPARECTGFPTGKPISCKIETIIWLSVPKKRIKKMVHAAASQRRDKTHR